jgi:hypothetical protein
MCCGCKVEQRIACAYKSPSIAFISRLSSRLLGFRLRFQLQQTYPCWWLLLLLQRTPWPWIVDLLYIYPALLLLSRHDYKERANVAHHLAAHIPTGLHATRRYPIPPATLHESCLELEEAARSGMATMPGVKTGISLRNSGVSATRSGLGG